MQTTWSRPCAQHKDSERAELKGEVKSPNQQPQGCRKPHNAETLHHLPRFAHEYLEHTYAPNESWKRSLRKVTKEEDLRPTSPFTQWHGQKYLPCKRDERDLKTSWHLSPSADTCTANDPCFLLRPLPPTRTSSAPPDDGAGPREAGPKASCRDEVPRPYLTLPDSLI